MEDQELTTHINKVCAILEDEAQEMAVQKRRTVSSCMSSLIRPYLAEYFHTKQLGNSDAQVDLRQRPWNVTVVFWDITQGISAGEIIAESEEETIYGLLEVGKMLREFVNELHSDENVTADDILAFNHTNMSKRLNGVRPAICRGSGEARMSIHYNFSTTEYYLCSVVIKKV